jgi:hypothetical protein
VKSESDVSIFFNRKNSIDMRISIKLSVIIMLIFVAFGCEDDTIIETEFNCSEEVDLLTLNQVQVIGSHNSYRMRTPDPIMQFMMASPEMLPPDFDPESWDYDHVSLAEQFETYNIRSIELDIYRDPQGGLFYYRKGNAIIGLDPESGEEALTNPGLKVLHFPDFDYLTHHLTFKDALQTVKIWSQDNPLHLPITILVEAKEDSPAQMLPGFGLTATLNFDRSGLAEIEQEIREVFPLGDNNVFTPDELRKGYNSLNEAAISGGWPTLGEMRGKVIFVLLGPEDVLENYKIDYPNLEGKSMFVFAEPGEPEAAFLKIDDPIENLEIIRSRIDEGYMVRTRADADTYEARTGDYTRMQAAFESGAQIISTDYYKEDIRSGLGMEWSTYKVNFANQQIADFNPVNGPLVPALLDCLITE